MKSPLSPQDVEELQAQMRQRLSPIPKPPTPPPKYRQYRREDIPKHFSVAAIRKVDAVGDRVLAASQERWEGMLAELRRHRSRLSAARSARITHEIPEAMLDNIIHSSRMQIPGI
jgi:hypothetical protein